jgi:hypothetical protein
LKYKVHADDAVLNDEPLFEVSEQYMSNKIVTTEDDDDSDDEEDNRELSQVSCSLEEQCKRLGKQRMMMMMTMRVP